MSCGESAGPPGDRAEEPRSGGRDFRRYPANLVRGLGRASLAADDGEVGALDALARAGLPVPEGFILTRAAHERFLLREDPLARDDELDERVLRALLDLGTARVAVVSEGFRRRGLGTVPAVFAALEGAWSHPGAVRPVLVRREPEAERLVRTGGRDLEPGRDRDEVGRLTEAVHGVLGRGARLEWALERGSWLLLSALPAKEPGRARGRRTG